MPPTNASNKSDTAPTKTPSNKQYIVPATNEAFGEDIAMIAHINVINPETTQPTTSTSGILNKSTIPKIAPTIVIPI